MGLRHLILCLLLSQGLLFGQTYQVIKVAGTITTLSDGDTLHRADKIKAGDTLCFTNTKTKRSIAAIMDIRTRARYLMKAKTDTNGSHEGRVKDLLSASRTRTGTRKGDLNTLLDMGTYLGKADFLILGGELELEVNPKTLPMRADNFFYATYTYKGDTINKKLPFEGNILKLNAKQLYKVDNAPVSPAACSAISLYYYQPTTGIRKSVSTFRPVFLDTAGLQKELDAVLRSSAGTPDIPALKEALINRLVKTYHKADKDNLDQWLDDFLIDWSDR